MGRASNVVTRVSDPSFDVELSAFLKTHFHAGHRLRALTAFDATFTEPLEAGESGLDSTSDSHRFKFSVRRRADEFEQKETIATKRARTEAWAQSMNRRST